MVHCLGILLNVLYISLSCILCSPDFLMIKIIHDDRMPLRHSAVRQFIIHKGAIISLSHFFGLFF